MSEEGTEVEIYLGLNGVEIERLVTVADDLEYLQNLPTDRLLTHAEVRLAASVLRRLFVDNQLGALLRRAAGGSPFSALSIRAVNIDVALNAWNPAWVRYAFAGGAVVSGAHHTGVILGRIPKVEHEKYGSFEKFLEANPLPLQGMEQTGTLPQFLNSTSVAMQAVGGGLVRIPRRTVIQYIANRKGGVHFDPQRRPTVGSMKKQRKEAHYQLLDHALLRVGHLTGPEFEVASIVRAVADTDWAVEIIRAAKELAPEDFGGDPTEMKIWTGLQEADGTGWATTTFGPNRPASEAESEAAPPDTMT